MSANNTIRPIRHSTSCGLLRFAEKQCLATALLGICFLSTPQAARSQIDDYTVTCTVGHTQYGGFRDQAGFSLARAGDRDRDGELEFITGSPYSFYTITAVDPDTAKFSGRVEVVEGTLPVDVFSADSIDWYTREFGFSVSSGDVNGDGLPDYVIGAPASSSKSDTLCDIGLVDVRSGKDRQRLLRIKGTYAGSGSPPRFGAFVHVTGDVDGDGGDDFIVLESQEGVIGVYSGLTGARLSGAQLPSFGLPYELSLHPLEDVTGDGLRDFAHGNRVYSGSGGLLCELPTSIVQIGNAGDQDGDGVEDIAAVSYTSPGTVSIEIYSGTGSHLSTISVDQGDVLPDLIWGGLAITSLGDVDADGFPDIGFGGSSYGGLFCWNGGYFSIYSGKDGHRLYHEAGSWPGGIGMGLGIRMLGVGLPGDGRPDDFVVGFGYGEWGYTTGHYYEPWIGGYRYYYCPLPKVDLVDPRHEMREGFLLGSADASTWANSTFLVDGLAADGRTNLVVRMFARGFTSAEVDLTDDLPPDCVDTEDPTLVTLDGLPLTPGTSIAPLTVDGRRYFMFRVVAPDAFIPVGLGWCDEIHADHVSLRLTNSRGGTYLSGGCVEIWRPPLVLLHGLLGNATSFSPQFIGALSKSGYRQVTSYAYTATNSRTLAANLTVPETAVQEALDRLSAKGVAGTQVDLVAHSMGGLVARVFASVDELYLREDNFFSGDYYRVITLGTPHTGSPLANWTTEMIDACESGNASPLACWGLNSLESWFTGRLGGLRMGAVDDLHWFSNTIQLLKPLPAPSHAFIGASISGTAPDVGEAKVWRYLKPLYYLFTGQTSPFSASDPFCGVPGDWVVPQSSAAAGFASNCVTVLPDVPHSLLKEQPVISAVSRQLDLPPSDPNWCMQTVPLHQGICDIDKGSEAQGRFTLSEEDSPAWPTATVLTYRMAITNPPLDSQVTSGDSVLIRLAFACPDTSLSVFLLGEGVFEEVVDHSTPVKIAIPRDRAGTWYLDAIGLDSVSGLQVAAPLRLKVVPRFAISDVDLMPENLTVSGTGDFRQLGVVGTFGSDYATKYNADLTSADAGTQFYSSNPAAAIVTSQGLLIGVGQGTTWIRAVYGMAVDSSQVIVGAGSLGSWPDTLAPVIQISPPLPDTAYEGDAIVFDVAVTDEASGIVAQSMPSGTITLRYNLPSPQLLRISATDGQGNVTELDHLIVVKEADSALCGDVDGSGLVDIADVVYLVAFIFTHGPAPSPLAAADADCSGDVTIADCVYLISYIFSHGPQPCETCR